MTGHRFVARAHEIWATVRAAASREIFDQDSIGGLRLWPWFGCFLLGAMINSGTALLRLDSFFPFPQAYDFPAYYAGAWATRVGTSPYPWADGFLQQLVIDHEMVVVPSPLHSAPLWSWLIQPLTAFSFPVAASIWLALLLLIIGYCHFLMVRIAGYKSTKVVLWTLPITLTFGPLFLNLTLGQNGPFLLLGILLMGEAVRRRSRLREIFSAVVWVVAVSAKIYPVLWIVGLFVLRRWRLFVLASAVLVVMFGAIALSEPGINGDYYLRFMTGRARLYAEEVSVDDQSLGGFLVRLGTPSTYTFPGLKIESGHEVAWALPWSFSARAMRSVAYAILAVLGVFLGVAWVRGRGDEPEGVLFSLALYGLLLLPHMDRYNHILVLPAIAWLWGRQEGKYRKIAILAYGVFSLSRLNHLWAMLPAPIGPLASGAGTIGVVVLMAGVSHALTSRGICAKIEPVGG